MIEIIQIDMTHSLYEEERLLRNEVLLRPIGVPDYGWEQNDDSAWHFIAIKDRQVIGCVLLVPMDDQGHSAQLTQMAVRSSVQGQGVGKLLIQALLDFSEKNALKEIHIHARDTVTQFYQRFGFSIYGDEFEEVGIKHRLMSRQIDPSKTDDQE